MRFNTRAIIKRALNTTNVQKIHFETQEFHNNFGFRSPTPGTMSVRGTTIDENSKTIDTPAGAGVVSRGRIIQYSTVNCFTSRFVLYVFRLISSVVPIDRMSDLFDRFISARLILFMIPQCKAPTLRNQRGGSRHNLQTEKHKPRGKKKIKIIIIHIILSEKKNNNHTGN